MADFGRLTPSGGDPSLNEINRADRFLDALAGKQPVYSTDPAEAELAFLLSDWRDTVRDPAPTVPVTARDAVAALNDGLSKRHSRGSRLAIGSTAAALLCIGGFGAAIYSASPGDTFYGARTALFGTQRVSDDEVMLAAQTEMEQVQTLIDQGQWQQAQDKLQQLSPQVQSVDAPEHKQQLIQQWNALTYKVVEQNPAATLPPAGEPLPPLPSSQLTLLPVPVIVLPGGPPSHTTRTSQSDSTEPSTTDTSAPGSTDTSASTPPSTATGTSVPPSTDSSVPSTSAVPRTSAATTPSSASAASSSATSATSTPISEPPATTTVATSAQSTKAASSTVTPTSAPPPGTAEPSRAQAPSTAASPSAASGSPVTTSVIVSQTTTQPSPASIPSPVVTVPAPVRELPSVRDVPPLHEVPSHGSAGAAGANGAGVTQTSTSQRVPGQH